MINRVILILSMVICASELIGQSSLGLKIGYTQSNMNYFLDEERWEDLLDITRPEISLFANFRLRSPLEIATNLTYLTKGAEFPGLVIWDFNAIEISSTLNITKSLNNIHVSGYLGLGLSHITKWYEERPNQSRREVDMADSGLNRNELSLPYGIEVGYRIRNVIIFTDIKFRRPMSKLINDSQTKAFSISASNKSKSLSLGLRYTFGEQ